jgi:hypothetical protein
MAEAIVEILQRPRPPRRHRTSPRIIKRLRRKSYRIRRPHDTTTRHHGPPEIRIWVPFALSSRHCLYASAFLPVSFNRLRRLTQEYGVM